MTLRFVTQIVTEHLFWFKVQLFATNQFLINTLVSLLLGFYNDIETVLQFSVWVCKEYCTWAIKSVLEYKPHFY